MGRTVFITGSNRGIGWAILEEFSNEAEITIIAHARQKYAYFESGIERISREKGCKIVPVIFDYSDEIELKHSMNQLLSQFKKIDVLINNVGQVFENSTFLMLNHEKLRKSFQINFFSPVLVTQLVVKSMIRNLSGSIINICSMSIYDVGAAQFEYITSKAAVAGMTHRLAFELAPYRIRCNAVAPGLIETDMVAKMIPELKEMQIKKSFLKRAGGPREIARTVYFLSSDAASYINGQVIRVDGGSSGIL